MAHLEEITVGCQLNGIAARETVTVIAVQWYGNAALEVTFKNSRGQLGSQILYRGDEATVDVLGDSLPWSFGADADKMRLVSEAYRIHLAHLFDPYLAVHTSAIQPLPHQITAVYQEMLPRLPLRLPQLPRRPSTSRRWSSSPCSRTRSTSTRSASPIFVP